MTDDLFFDTDCLSAFLWINNTNILQSLYGGKIVLPEPVYQELSNPIIPHIKKRTDVLISNNVAKIQNLDVGTEEYKLYETLIKGEKGMKQIGRGEASGIALAKKYNGILASNNYKDISPYIEKYKLKHTDTGHILVEALDKKLITEADGNTIWKQMLDKNRKLPDVTFSDYLRKR
jgi:predicted nucleic acid-binding protein